MSPPFDEDVFSTLVEHSLEAFALIQPHGRATYVSPAITRILGYSPDEFTTLDLFQIVHPDDTYRGTERFQQFLKQADSSYASVHRIRHKDGSWRWVECVFTNRLQLPKVSAIIANLRDVTEQKQTAESLRGSEEKFRGIVESATEFAIVTLDLEGRVSSWNSGAHRLLGYDAGEVLGKDCGIFFTPEDNASDRPEAEMRDALIDGRGTDERWHVKKNGTRFWGSGFMMPLRDDRGAIHGYLKIFRDMTRSHRAEEALKDASRKKDEFLAMLAHELRNPLAAISNAGALLLVSASEPETLSWVQEVISRQARYLSRLLDDLLDVSRITQGKIRLHEEFLDLSPLIAKAIESVRPIIEQKKHTVLFTVSPVEIPVFGDALRIEQILINLLVNAAKYTDERGRISVTAIRGTEAVVSIRDSGIGIAPEMLRHIFEPFTQVDTSLDRSSGGLGIGLTLAQSLVELHGGTLVAQSDGLGQGSEFVLTLPLADK